MMDKSVEVNDATTFSAALGLNGATSGESLVIARLLRNAIRDIWSAMFQHGLAEACGTPHGAKGKYSSPSFHGKMAEGHLESANASLVLLGRPELTSCRPADLAPIARDLQVEFYQRDPREIRRPFWFSPSTCARGPTLENLLAVFFPATPPVVIAPPIAAAPSASAKPPTEAASSASAPPPTGAAPSVAAAAAAGETGKGATPPTWAPGAVPTAAPLPRSNRFEAFDQDTVAAEAQGPLSVKLAAAAALGPREPSATRRPVFPPEPPSSGAATPSLFDMSLADSPGDDEQTDSDIEDLYAFGNFPAPPVAPPPKRRRRKRRSDAKAENPYVASGAESSMSASSARRQTASSSSTFGTPPSHPTEDTGPFVAWAITDPQRLEEKLHKIIKLQKAILAGTVPSVGLCISSLHAGLLTRGGIHKRHADGA